MALRARSDGMEAGYLESPFGPLFCAYHPPSGAFRRDAAVLFCDAFGSDRMNLHRPYRAFALRLAELGFPALRVDYPGTCDSAGHPRDPGHFRSWLASLHVAADYLERRSGASELGLFGALLGGTIATVFAASRPEATALALWGPLPNGRAFLRELTAFRSLTRANPDGVRSMHYEPGDREAIGFLITEETADELATLDAFALPLPSVRAAALFPRNRASPLERFADHLRRAGASVELSPEAPFDMNDLVNDRAPLPLQLVEDVGAFFERTFPEREPARAAPAAPPLAPETVLANRKGVPVREAVASFGADGDLFGIVTQSLSPIPDARPAVLLVNGGHNHRVGINRNYTEWARDWAALGLTVMRMDIRGLGDSPPDPRSVGQVLYRDATREDVRDAMDFLTERYGAKRFVALGLCAGGYQAFHAALGDARIAALAMLNPLRFERLASEAPVERGELASGATLGHYARAAFDPEAWKRLLASGRDPRPLARSFATKVVSRVALHARRLPFALSPSEAPPASWLSSAFLDLTGRGCEVLVVFADGDPMEPILDERTGPDRARLERSGRFRVERIPDADHIFSPIVSQERLERVLREALCRWAAIAAPPRRISDHP